MQYKHSYRAMQISFRMEPKPCMSCIGYYNTKHIYIYIYIYVNVYVMHAATQTIMTSPMLFLLWGLLVVYVLSTSKIMAVGTHGDFIGLSH